MNKKEAYKIVFEDLKKCKLFTGHYDAKNGSTNYMYGISAIMEFIAYEIDNLTGKNFENEFWENMAESEKKVKRNETH